MSKVWTEEERESCRAAVRSDNPLFSAIEVDLATDIWLKFTEEMEHRLLYGEGSASPTGLFGYTHK